MDKKAIVFASSCYPEALYNSLTARKLDQQAQKFNRLVMKGFVQNGWDVTAVSYLSSIPCSDCPEDGVFEGINRHFISTAKKGYVGWLQVIRKSYAAAKKALSCNAAAIVGCDVLNVSASLGVLLAAKKLHRRAVGFVTDVPTVLSANRRSFHTRINNRVIGLCSDYVFLTKQMQELIPVAGKKFTVMEGLADTDADINEIEKKPQKGKVILYAGTLHRKYGIADLIAAFTQAAVPDAELHIYGDGDYRREVEEICKSDPTVKYFGVVPNYEIVFAEREADVLVNPRRSNEEFTRYSFPSKVTEYMSSGTPVLMNLLPGIPDEYGEYCYCFESETHDGYVRSLRKVLTLSVEELRETGQRAAEFVAEKKNCKVQICRVIQKLGLQ